MAFCGTFYVLLIAIGLNHKEVLILAGLIALIQGIAAFLEPLTNFIGEIGEALKGLWDQATSWWPFW